MMFNLAREFGQERKRNFDSSFRVAFVNANSVAVEIENHCHATRGTIHRLNAEFHVVLFQLRNSFVEIFHLERGGATVGTRLEHSGRATDGQRIRAEFIFDPLAVTGIRDSCGFQVQHALVKITRAFHVRDGVTTKSEFENFEHKNLV